ncbi:hypothetical protein SISSUDRAFT_1038695, partial [Sistotremastrum suecicum HHB10207 ss-3]
MANDMSSRSMLASFFSAPIDEPTQEENTILRMHRSFSGMSEATDRTDLSVAVHDAYFLRTETRQWHQRESAAVINDWIDAKAIFEDSAVFTLTFTPTGNPRSLAEVQSNIKYRLPLQYRYNDEVEEFFKKVVKDLGALIEQQAMRQWYRAAFSPAVL